MNDAEGELRAGLASLGFDAQAIAPKLVEFAELVLSANKTTNLVGAHSIQELVAAHLLDSLAPFARLRPRGSLIDVGSGAGLPAIPLAVAFPSTTVRMLEPREKRYQFLRSAIDRLHLANAGVFKVMAESAGRGELRESADLVTVRAVAQPSTALEIGGALVALHGQLLLYIGRQAEPSPHEIDVAAQMGLELEEAKNVEVPYLQGARHAWWFRKKKRTPGTYPRRVKTPSKQPL